MNNFRARYFKALMIAYSSGFSLILGMTFATAYLNASKMVVVDINYFGEANMELILLILVIPTMLISNWAVMKDIIRAN